jgi:hypothetical protein
MVSRHVSWSGYYLILLPSNYINIQGSVDKLLQAIEFISAAILKKYALLSLYTHQIEICNDGYSSLDAPTYTF